MADYTLDQLRSLWEEGSKAGNFAPAEYQTRQSPEGEGGGGQTYEAYGVSPNSILLQNGDPRYSMPTLTKLSDEDGGGFRSVTDMLGGAEHVTYSPEGKVIDRKFYENPTPSHQDFLKRAGMLAAGVGGLSALAGAGAAGAAGAGGFGITPEAIASLYGGAAPEAVGAGLAGTEFASLNPSMFEGATELLQQGLPSLPGDYPAVPEANSPIPDLPGDYPAVPEANSPIPDLPGDYPAVPDPGSSTSTSSNWMKDLLRLAIAGGLGVAASKGSGRSSLKPVGGKGPDPKARRWDPKTQTYYSTATGERIYKAAAGGGISGLPRNEYKAGGRYLSGPGDGMSDNIKANIDGVQEARLADGEFVIPADVVSHIGNGSSNAGAKKLHDMMNRIRHARTGNPRQGRRIKAEKYLPV